METIDFSVEKPLRLDQYLSEQLPMHSRSRLQKLIEDGFVLVDGKQAKAGQKLKIKQMISVTLPPLKELAIEAEDIPITIVYEDDYLAVVDKPTGMVTHPGAGVDSGTLVHALLHHMQGSLSGISGVLRPGIVHRLDKDTSGLMIVAKEDRAHRQLSRQIQSKEAKRIYLAVVEGLPAKDEGIVNAPIGRDPRHRTRMAIVGDGRTAETHYRVLKRSHKHALLELELKTGRTHQIRVHMKSLNCPVVGDIVYNTKTTGTLVARSKLGLMGQALHAHRLVFAHPIDGRLLEFESPLPQDLAALVDKLF
jgi:23S rRNA pseudouridine1911/1915/1917 synthase